MVRARRRGGVEALLDQGAVAVGLTGHALADGGDEHIAAARRTRAAADQRLLADPVGTAGRRLGPAGCSQPEALRKNQWWDGPASARVAVCGSGALGHDDFPVVWGASTGDSENARETRHDRFGWRIAFRQAHDRHASDRYDPTRQRLPGPLTLMSIDDSDFDLLLAALRDGNTQAWPSMVRMIYDDLRRLARAQLGHGGRDRTMNTTALVHECYFRMSDAARKSVESKNHFFNLASRIMRQVLCDYAREQLALKRGGNQQRATFDGLDIAVEEEAQQLVELDQLLRALEAEDERLARVFEHRYFGGLSEEECADALNISVRTVQRDWNSARKWLAERYPQH